MRNLHASNMDSNFIVIDLNQKNYSDYMKCQMFKFIVKFKEVALISTFVCREFEIFEINLKVAMRSP
jgi:hypothetical protein